MSDPKKLEAKIFDDANWSRTKSGNWHFESRGDRVTVTVFRSKGGFDYSATVFNGPYETEEEARKAAWAEVLPLMTL
jgi:hypothetical protein